MQRLKKRVLPLLLVFLLVIGSSLMLIPRNLVSAETGDVTWSWDDNGTLTISGTGEMEDYSRHVSDTAARTPWRPYDGDIVRVKIENGVTSIGDYSFFGCRRLTNIVIPDSVTRIGGYAFGLCESLTNITIPDGVTSIGYMAFVSCTSLSSITIPDGVTNIEDAAFQNCTRLTSITIPDSVTSIADSAFFYCGNLRTVYYGGSKEQWDQINIDDGNASLHNATIVFAETSSDSVASSESQSAVTHSASTGSAEAENAVIAPSGNDAVVVLIVLAAVLVAVVAVVLILRRRLKR